MTFRLRRSSAVGGAVVGTAAVITLGAGLAAAQEPPEEPIAIAPPSGPPGTSIAVSGDGCLGGEVALGLLLGDDFIDDGSATPDAEGSWSGTLDVPDEGFEEDTDLAVVAECIGGDVVYADAFFMVDVDEGPPPTDPPPTTPPPTDPPGTQPPPTAPPGGQPAPPITGAPVQPAVSAPVRPTPAPPAAPVVARPRYTG